MTNLTQTRGDTAGYTFKRVNAQGETITTTPDKLYFTIKQSFHSKTPMLQKTIDDMTMAEDGTWSFVIQAGETDNYEFGSYVYDIEVIDNDRVSTIAKGKFTLTEEATWKTNED